MNKANTIWKRLALAIAALAAIPALAVPQATGSGFDINSPGLLPSADNLLYGLTPTVVEGDHSWYNGGSYGEDVQTSDFGCLCDGAIPNVERTDATARALLPSNSVVTWTWTDPKPLTSVRIYARWDGYRNDVSVSSIEVCVDDEWTTLANSEFSYARRQTLNTVQPYNHDLPQRVVTFADSEGDFLATGVTGLRITFGDQSGLDHWDEGVTLCYGAYWEIEASESLQDPVLTAFGGGVIRDLLHLGSSMGVNLPSSLGAIGVDHLSSAGGEAKIKPAPGDVVSLEGTDYVWTPLHNSSASGNWFDYGDSVNNYIAYLHGYIYVDGAAEKAVKWKFAHDDGMRVWLNGTMLHQDDVYVGDKHEVEGTLRPGFNAVMFKLAEGTGGDFIYAELNAADGGNLTGVSLSYAPPFLLSGKVSGDGDTTASTTLAVRRGTAIGFASKYMITESGVAPDADDSGWLDYDPSATTFPDYTFETPDSVPATVTLHSWFKDETGAVHGWPCMQIVYDVSAPTIIGPNSVELLHTKNYGLRRMIPEELYDSVSDNYGIASATVSPQFLGAQGGSVTLTIVNKLGISASKTVNVTFKNGFGSLPQGWLSQFLHLGAKFATDDPAYNGIDVDLLSAFGGQANMRPYCGQVLSPIATSRNCSTPGSLTWTPIERIRENGDWRPDESSNDGRNEYNKYWHVYVVSPDSEEREIQFLHSNDDDLRVWVNGNLQVSNGGANHNYTAKGTLYPGVNSIMVRLREGGGGDYMAIAIRKPDGTYFDDLTYSLDPPDEFNLACVASGSADWTGSATVNVAKFPFMTGATKCQITFSSSSSSVDESAWVDYTYGENPYTTVTFPSAMATPGVSMQCYAWFKIGDDLRSVESTPIKFSDSAPTLELHTAVLDAHAEGGHVVDPYELISSVSGGESGLYKVWSEPTAVTADGTLRIHAMNMAGLEVVKSVSYIVDRLETCLVVPDEFDAPVSGTAKVSSSTASVRVQYAAEGATKTNKFNIAFGDIVDGIGEFSGSIRNLEAGGTYYWIVEVIDGGSVVGSRKGSFTTYLAEKHGSVKTICADLKTIDDDVILTYNGWGKVEFKHSVAASVLLVGGGGGGGVWVGGGGGGGGVVYRENVVIPAGKYVINVGEGGVGASWDGKVAAANGGDSYIDGLQSRGLLAYGGGAGGGSGYTFSDGQYFWGGTNAGADGGSGGGASGHAYADGTLIGEGLPEQGHDGGTAVVEGQAGGGGGAGVVGGAGNANDSGIGGAGGDGIACTITGAEVYYGGGGGGGCGTYGGTDKQSAGGLGGGGKGGYLNSGNNCAVPGTDGEDGLGGGGGGAGKAFAYNDQQGGHGGGHGGRGVVIIRFTQKFSDGSHKATGGNEVLKVPGVGCTYMVHIFTEDGTFELPDSAKIDVFMVGGGGAGGSGYLCGGGGGGAGGVIRREGLEVIEGVYDVVVGAGGIASEYVSSDNVNAKGKSSTFAGLEAFGGGGGGSLYTGGGAGVAGGSGGGAAGGGHEYVNSQSAGGAGVEGQGNAGGANIFTEYYGTDNRYTLGAGGGGAGSAGHSPELFAEEDFRAGAGGTGVMCDWTGEELWFAAGGGGGNHNAYWCNTALGGSGVGGNGGNCNGTMATAGAANTGSGGGGGYMDGGNRGKDGGDGGSGIVIIRYKLNPERFKLTIR